MAIDLRIRKSPGRDFTLDVGFHMDGGRLGILGASGSGKSMTLRSLAGIETPDRGAITLNGRVLFDAAARINLPPQRRRVGYLFQSYALFPNMTVAGNIAVALAGTGKERRARTGEYLERFGLAGMENRLPHQLSGGQQQRVATARMLAADPEAVLLDEPFSALDSHLRERMELQLLDLLRDRDDVILVTHSRDVAYRFATHILAIDGGRVLAFGPTRELFRNPGRIAVAALTGCKNISRIEKTGAASFTALDWGVDLTASRPVPDNATHAGIRAHDLQPVPPGEAGVDNVIAIRVTEQAEDVFEWNVIFAPAASPDPDRHRLWYKYSKYAADGVPGHLRVPPEAIMFLE
ncbi:MAG: ATP-binding cassette domain-containing protein [Planctomycetes bacterium]|nr:ATP-binding cassette domain-containing protein [Planctomycetota bacterium]